MYLTLCFTVITFIGFMCYQLCPCKRTNGTCCREQSQKSLEAEIKDVKVKEVPETEVDARVNTVSGSERENAGINKLDIKIDSDSDTDSENLEPIDDGDDGDAEADVDDENTTVYICRIRPSPSNIFTNVIESCVLKENKIE